MDRKFDVLERALVTAVCPARPYTAKVPQVLDLFRFVMIAVAGWMNQQTLVSQLIIRIYL
jgi:hypothetical protein